MSPSAPEFAARHAQLSETLTHHKLDSLLLNPGPSLAYLTGLSFHLMERPTVVLFTPGKAPVIVLPELEIGKVASLPFEMHPFPYGEDPSGWPEAFTRAAQAARLPANSARIGVEPTRLRVLELRYMEQAVPGASFVSAEDSLTDLRICKDANEVAAMHKAVQIAQEALQATLPVVKAGVTERQIASELTMQLLRAGSDAEFPFAPIVSGGPNAANPHASPGDRPLREGDLLVIDWGAIHNGYISDLTRTFAIGEVDEEWRRIARIVLEANQAGRSASRPGIPAEAVDQAARQVIEQAGYGKYFIHRTGHGIGMEGHEPPYMRAGNRLILKPGMAFTVEPGIYIPDRNGVRIEDNVVITETGAQILSDLPRELITLPV